MRCHSLARGISYSTDGCVQFQMTGCQGTSQRILPAPPASASRSAKKPIDATALADIFARVGLEPLSLTRNEAARVRETPGISWTKFYKKIGARCRSEWATCEMIPGYKRFLCADLVAQPYVPVVPGNPGIVIRPPATVWTPQDPDRMFQVFSRTHDNLLQYCGEYITVPDVQIELDWFDLPHDVRMINVHHIRIRLTFLSAGMLG
jgi:hypothetical protein